MVFSLDQHEDGCTPLAPCKSCLIVEFLRENLGLQKFEQFTDLLRVQTTRVRSSASDLDLRIEELELSARAHGCLKNEGILTVRDIVKLSEVELLRIPNFGRKSLNELKEVLRNKVGLVNIVGWTSTPTPA